MELHIDLYSVMIAAVLYTIIFLCWYSKWLFGPIWIKPKGMKETEFRNSWWGRVSWNFLLGLSLSYFLAFFDASLQVTSVGDAMFTSLCIWLGFVLPVQIFPVIWHKKSARVFFVETGFMLLSLLVMGGIIGA
jgi:hypothetical protein